MYYINIYNFKFNTLSLNTKRYTPHSQEEVDMFLEGYGFMKFETEKEGEENNANGEADEKARASAAKEEMKEHHGRIN